ncbi:MAG: type II secretion system protein, partial [Akkermansiaceae bacterium]|nr:type II secretion system protein [Armatimonadota bacterium]
MNSQKDTPIRSAFVYRRGASQSAFTLIELLVVIAIIAILGSILFPVFAQARAKARQSVNISNLRQVGMGFLQYVQDYDECVVPYRVRSGESPYSTLNNRYWFGRTSSSANAPYNAPPYTAAPCPQVTGCNLYLDKSDGLLYPYMKNAEIQDDPAARDVVLPTFTNWYNGAETPGYTLYTKLFPDWVGTTTTDVSLADIKEPANTFLMADGATYNFTSKDVRKVIFVDVPWSGTSDNGQGNFSFSARIHGRHAGGVACVLWADGHVKAMRPVFRAKPAGPI